MEGKEDRRYFTGEDIVKLVESIGLKDIKKKDVILKSQSINNWLDNTKTTEAMKKEIIKRHHDVSDEYKKAANFKFNQSYRFGDCDILICFRYLFRCVRQSVWCSNLDESGGRILKGATLLRCIHPDGQTALLVVWNSRRRSTDSHRPERDSR